MKIRDFKYKGFKFHLNDNGSPNSSWREYEGKYDLLCYNDAYNRWESITKVDTKKEALIFVKEYYK